MSNYKQTTVSGEAWKRAKRIVIEHPVDSAAEVKFVEEQVVNTSEGSFQKDLGILSVKSTQDTMQEQIPILDPATGHTTGQLISYAEVYNVLKSAYLYFAQKRDGPDVTEEPAGDNNG